MAVSLVSVRLPTGDTPVCNVTLEPYVLIKRGDTTVTIDDIPEEGSGEGLLQLRSRWYRSCIPQRGGSVCSVHPDKEATVQCTLCVRSKVAQHLSYHCAVQCFKSTWQQHKEYHRHAFANGENGYDLGAGKAMAASSTLSIGGETWVEVGQARRYTPGTEDVGFTLRYEATLLDSTRRLSLEGRCQAAYTSRVRPAPTLPVRHMVQLPLPHGVPQQGAMGRFTLLTYNLLADLYAKSDVCSHCPAWAMAWHYRKRNLVREMLAASPDILCLQEVQSDHYADFLQPELAKAGYSGIYKRKTTEVFTGSTYAIDGCATFFKRERLSLVKKYEVEFNKAAVSLADQMGSAAPKKATINRLLKDNVALIAVLEASDAGGGGGRGPKQLLCVANTHIHANPELNDVKLWQVHTLLKGLEKIANSAAIPMLVAGDFNSTPGSAPHTLLVRGGVDPPAHSDPATDPFGILRNHKLSHSLPLASAYGALARVPHHHLGGEALRRQRARLDPAHHEPLFTNIDSKGGFKGTLDYILYSTDSLVPTALLELPSEAEVVARPDEGLPNANWSSDHISLMAEFVVVGHHGR